MRFWRSYIIREKVLNCNANLCNFWKYLNVIKEQKKMDTCSSWNLSTLSSNRALCIAQGSFMYYAQFKSVNFINNNKQSFEQIFISSLFNWFLCNHTVFSNFTLTIDIEIWNSLERVKSFYFCNFSWNVADKRKCPTLNLSNCNLLENWYPIGY